MRRRDRIPIVTTREYGSIKLPGRLDTPRTRERLEAAGVRAGLRTFESRGSSLYALGIVGVIDVGNVIVEILPKTSSGTNPADGAAFLGDLLRFLETGGKPTIVPAAIADTGGGLFELILNWAVSEAARNLVRGLPRRYVALEEISSAIRGKVDLRHLARQRPGRAFEVLVRHAPLGENNLISRTVKWLLGEIARRTFSMRTRALCLKLIQSMAGTADMPPGRHELDDLRLLRMEEHWQPLMLFARALMAQGEPDPARGGQLPSIAVLFSLHGLFEQAVRRVLTTGLPALGLACRTEHRRLLLDAGDGSLIQLKPDFQFTPADGSAGVVGDAKWKRIFRGHDRVQLSEPDAYQITSYLAATGAGSAFIVSPIDSDDPALITRRFAVRGIERPLVLLGVHLPTLIANTAIGGALRAELCAAVARSLSASARGDGSASIPAAHPTPATD